MILIISIGVCFALAFVFCLALCAAAAKPMPRPDGMTYREMASPLPTPETGIVGHDSAARPPDSESQLIFNNTDDLRE